MIPQDLNDLYFTSHQELKNTFNSEKRWEVEDLNDLLESVLEKKTLAASNAWNGEDLSPVYLKPFQFKCQDFPSAAKDLAQLYFADFEWN
ncbi:MAG: hypothetical protein ACPF8V_11485 [Luteibaculum sp.]